MARANFMNGVLLGAGLMYLMDPDRGRRRRSLLRDQLLRGARDLNDGLDTSVRDLRHRGVGVLAGARTRVTGRNPDDPVLEARVRSKLGRVVSHPGSVQVIAREGAVTLSGPVLAREVEGLLAAVGSVPGVRDVENRLQVHQGAGNVPGLQGEGRRQEAALDLMQESWSPGTRLLASIAGGTMALYGLSTRGVTGTVLGTLGAGLLARGLANIPAQQLVGFDGSRRVIDIHKSINVDAPVEEVFEFWSRFENFPRFMSHLRTVRRTTPDLSRWVAEGPAGVPVEWDAEITQWVPGEAIGWRSVEGSTVGNAGVVRFQRNEGGGTRVDVRMTYNPPAGAIGHAVAAFFGSDPKRAMDDDLVRFKSLIEHGRTSSRGDEVAREELAGSGTRENAQPRF